MSVKIIASKNNRVFEPTAKYASNGGLMMLAVEEIDNSPVGFGAVNGNFVARKQRRIAFVMATQQKFDEIFKTENINPVAGAVLPGIVAITETMVPVNPKDPSQGIKYANAAMKAANKPLTVGGKPIYRTTEWLPTAGDRTADMLEDLQDITITHDNQSEISAFVATMNAQPAAKANTPALAASSPATNSRRRSATTA